MGWTLFACFGCSHVRKRPRPSSKLGPKRKRIQGYQQLQSDVVKELHEDLRDDEKKEKKIKIRKKVRFNLDVIIYEPISDYDTSNFQDDPNEKHLKDQAVCLAYAPESTIQSFPANYRYNNCYNDEDNYDENKGDDSEFEFSDLEEDDDVGSVGNDYHDLSCKPLIGSTDKRLRLSSDNSTNARSRRHYAVPVLNPIENLSQWKAIKARKR